jgi:hypothetical protein
MNPTPSPLPINIHGNRGQTHSKRQSTNNKETIPYTLIGNPSINVKRQAKCKTVFDKVHNGKCF